MYITQSEECGSVIQICSEVHFFPACDCSAKRLSPALAGSRLMNVCLASLIQSSGTFS